MIPADDDMLLNRLKGATLEELYPGFDKEAEWDNLAQRFAAKPKQQVVRHLPVMKIAAAVALVCTVAGALLWNSGDKDPIQNILPVAAADTTPAALPEKVKEVQDNITLKHPVAAHMKRYSGGGGSRNNRGVVRISPVAEMRATGPICNGTLCPIEICISQTMRCASGKQAEISECRTLEPDQSGRLQLKGTQEIEKDCHLTVDEIRITRVSTGETILLNSSSHPASADEVFACLTGKADCSMMAGIFERDCNNNDLEGKLKIDARGGDVIIR